MSAIASRNSGLFSNSLNNAVVVRNGNAAEAREITKPMIGILSPLFFVANGKIKPMTPRIKAIADIGSAIKPMNGIHPMAMAIPPEIMDATPSPWASLLFGFIEFETEFFESLGN